MQTALVITEPAVVVVVHQVNAFDPAPGDAFGAIGFVFTAC